MAAMVAAAVFLLIGSAGNAFDPIAQAATLSARTPGYRMHMTLQISTPAFGAITGQADAVLDLRDRATSVSMLMQMPDVPQVTQALGGTTLSMDMALGAHGHVPQASAGAGGQARATRPTS